MSAQAGFFARFLIYQKERFPILAHGVLISAFTFSAMAYSNICRGASESFAATDFLKAFLNTFFIFFLLRISDEFKDKDYDRLNRPHLPVPRGLVSLSELRKLGYLVFVLITSFNLLFAFSHLYVYIFVLFYMALMYREFFLGHWLLDRPLWYVVSHMMIIPLVDTLASSFDWMGYSPDVKGLFWFFAVSFFNGCTLELGRKIKAEENEEANAYSLSLGFERALAIFQVVLLITFLLCEAAATYAGLTFVHHLIFVLLYVLCAGYGFYFRNTRTVRNAKWFERLSGIWAVLMYLNLGTGLFF